jgi:hypothetical protein
LKYFSSSTAFSPTRLRTQGIDLPPEEALDELQSLHLRTQTFDEDVAAVQDTLDDIAKGDKSIPFDQFDRDFRNRRNFQA